MNNSVFFKSKLTSPCLPDCPVRKEYSERGENCHPYCEKYLKYEKEKTAERKQHLKEVRPIWLMNEIEADRVDKYVKMRERKHR